MEIRQLTLKSIKNYFKVLRRKGIIDSAQVYKLLVLSFIEDLYRDKFSWYITEQDNNMLSEIVACIGRTTCIVPYTEVATHTEPIKNVLEDTPTRITQSGDIHLTEDVNLRLHSR